MVDENSHYMGIRRDQRCPYFLHHLIVDFDPEPVVSCNICYPPYGFETDAQPGPASGLNIKRLAAPDRSEAKRSYFELHAIAFAKRRSFAVDPKPPPIPGHSAYPDRYGQDQDQDLRTLRPYVRSERAMA